MRFGRAVRFAVVVVLSILGYPVPASASPDDSARIEIGRAIYERGILPGGEPLIAKRPEGFTLQGEYAACVGCHRRSGMGSVEGNVHNTVLVPPVAGPLLFSDARFATVPLDKIHHYIPNAAWERAVTRSAYDLPTLARAMREGIDPDGKPLISPMPRYDLDATAVEALAAYLAQLTNEPGPGIQPDVLHLATVITADADPGETAAVLGVLREWSDFARGSGARWRLHEWQLSGSADGWLVQLEAYYRAQPVFALLSGVGASEWEPVHRYCEQSRLPCVLPTLDVLPDVADDWYSIYYSPGVELEAGILVDYIADESSLQQGSRLVQIYADASGRHAANKLSDQLQPQGINAGQQRFRQLSPRATLRGVSDDDLLVLWLRPGEIMQLVTEFPTPPARRIFVSAFLASPEQLSLPEAWRQRIGFVSMFDDLGLQGELAQIRLASWLEDFGLADSTAYRRQQADAYAAGNLFDAALGKIRQQEIQRPPVYLNREHLIETLEDLIDKYSDSTDLVEVESHVAWYGRMSLGPRQRVAVRGGTILGYESSGSNRLKPLSKRIVP